MLTVKICGIRNLATAEHAIQSGADYIGFILHPNSPRAMTVPAVKTIFNVLSKTAQQRAVAVLVDQDLPAIEQLLTEIPLQTLQLHGSTARNTLPELHRLHPNIACIYALSYTATTQELDFFYRHATPADWLLIDSAIPGSGKSFDWDHLTQPQHRWLLAGGITPHNVQLALEKTHAPGIDVSSGVESTPGCKDHALIDALLLAKRRF